MSIRQATPRLRTGKGWRQYRRTPFLSFFFFFGSTRGAQKCPDQAWNLHHSITLSRGRDNARTFIAGNMASMWPKDIMTTERKLGHPDIHRGIS